MNVFRYAMLGILSIALSACGGGGSSSGGGNPPPVTSTKTVSGVVAVGALVTGADVVITDATGSVTPVVKTDAAGKYSIDVTNLTAPLVVKVNFVNGATTTMYSYAKPATSATDTTANVNPLTNVIFLSAAKIAGVPVGTANPAQLAALAAKEQGAYDLLTTVFSGAYTQLGVTGTIDPLTAAYVKGSQLDLMFDMYSFVVSGNTVSIVNKATGGAISSIPDVTTATTGGVSLVNAANVYTLDTTMTVTGLSASSGKVGDHFVITGTGFYDYTVTPSLHAIFINGVQVLNNGGETKTGLNAIVAPGCTTGTVMIVDTVQKTYFVSDKVFTVAYDANVKYVIGNVVGTSSLFLSGMTFVAGSVVDFVQNGTTYTVTPTAGNINPGAINVNVPVNINTALAYTIQVRDANGGVSNIFTKTP